MKTKTQLFASFAALILMTIMAGCDDGGTAGGPGAASPSTGKTPSGEKAPVVGTEDNAFKLDVPNTSTTIKQGEAQNVKIGISRGTNFNQDVTLNFGELPQGVTMDPASPVIKAGDKEASLTIKAAEDAAIGDFVVKITGHPATGQDAQHELKLKIDKK